MLRWYGYLGIALIILAQLNFFAKIEPFATWYIPIVWYGYILFVDSLVYKVKKRSLISNYPKEFLFLVALSVLFWSIFELYNIFTLSWSYANYVWYVHFLDFTTIMPAVLETFSLFTALKLGKRFDIKKGKVHKPANERLIVKLLVIFGAFITILPFLLPSIGFVFVWVGLFLLLDPLNYLISRPSVIQKVSEGKRGFVLRLFLSGITMGFFWEFWNYQAYPKWIYTFSTFLPNLKLFEMPLVGYLGYLPFALEVFLFYALFRSFLFKKGNDVLEIEQKPIREGASK
jgi:hypothetical protein